MASNMSKISAFLTMLVLAACGDPIKVGLPPPPASWLTCEPLPQTPNLSPLERITLPDGRVVYLAGETNARDAAIARYIVAVRGVHFECWNNAAKVRGYFGG
ncbi:MAG: hypothetical protein RQ750_13880 [Roseovarius sp.]|nr:hypothetical protein [Roseovarius sp.]